MGALAYSAATGGLLAMWLARTTGAPVHCEACAAANPALTIAERAYRWSCVACPWRSLWFCVLEGGRRVEEVSALDVLAIAIR